MPFFASLCTLFMARNSSYDANKSYSSPPRVFKVPSHEGKTWSESYYMMNWLVEVFEDFNVLALYMIALDRNLWWWSYCHWYGCISGAVPPPGSLPRVALNHLKSCCCYSCLKSIALWIIVVSGVWISYYSLLIGGECRAGTLSEYELSVRIKRSSDRC